MGLGVILQRAEVFQKGGKEAKLLVPREKNLNLLIEWQCLLHIMETRVFVMGVVILRRGENTAHCERLISVENILEEA